MWFGCEKFSPALFFQMILFMALSSSILLEEVAPASAWENPTVTVTPSYQSGTPGSTLTYAVSITNNDPPSFREPGASDFSLYCYKYEGWRARFLPTAFITLSPGETGYLTLEVTSLSWAIPGDYTFSVEARHTWMGSYSGTARAIYTVIVPPSTVQVTFQQTGVGSDYTGTILTVDSVTYAPSQLPKTFTWDYGTSHSFAWSSPLQASSGKRYVWTSTSGLSTAQSGTITPTLESGRIWGSILVCDIRGYYKTQFQLEIWVSPSWAGTTSPASGSCWCDAGEQVTISASPAIGYEFQGWSYSGNGGYADPSSSITVTMNGPITQTANFQIAKYVYGLAFLALVSIVTFVAVKSNRRRRQRLQAMKKEIVDKIDEVTRKGDAPSLIHPAKVPMFSSLLRNTFQEIMIPEAVYKEILTGRSIQSSDVQAK